MFIYYYFSQFKVILVTIVGLSSIYRSTNNFVHVCIPGG